MKTNFTNLCLALGGVALTLLQPLTVKGQDQFFNNKDGRVTFLVDAKIDGMRDGNGNNLNGNYLGERCPVKLGDKIARLDIPSFKINGQLWGLIGELVEVYYAKYTLGDRLFIPVSADTMTGLSDMPNGANGLAYCVIWRKLTGTGQATLTEREFNNQKHYELAVSSDLFDQIAISSQFHMDITFGRGNLGGCTVSRNYPAILGRAGAWGWDVPGSPDWEKAFAGMNHDQATNYWQILKTETHTVDAKVSDLSIYLGDFMAALHAANPDAADKLSAAMSGYPRNILTDQPAAGLPALQEVGQNVAKELAAGNLTEATRTAAAQATALALNGSPKMKEMAERLNGVLKLAANPGGSQNGENSLGMKFVAVPGTTVKFCIWDVRVKDYRAYAEAVSGVDASWQNPGFSQGDDHPVVNVSWNDAKSFCEWLSRKEGKTYRLPTEAEWNVAVGDSKYPWGNTWPPPDGACNYAPASGVEKFKYTSPVGSFTANEHGLYDMVGNASQWCEDWFDENKMLHGHVFRGCSWMMDRGSPADCAEWMTSSFRDYYPAGNRLCGNIGFRVVLDAASSR